MESAVTMPFTAAQEASLGSRGRSMTKDEKSGRPLYEIFSAQSNNRAACGKGGRRGRTAGLDFGVGWRIGPA